MTMRLNARRRFSCLPIYYFKYWQRLCAVTDKHFLWQAQKAKTANPKLKLQKAEPGMAVPGKEALQAAAGAVVVMVQAAAAR
jgi:hypothetical protein